MSNHILDWTVTLKSNNGVIVDEFDCTVECTVKRENGEPYLHSIDAILVTNGRGSDLKVTDLLDKESRLHPLGELAKALLEKDEGLASLAIDEHNEFAADDYADHKRDLIKA